MGQEGVKRIVGRKGAGGLNSIAFECISGYPSGMDRQKLREAIQKGQYEWRRHTVERMMERNIDQQEVREVLLEGEEIESYPQDRPHPSALFFKFVKSRPLHVVATFDEAKEWAYIITAYEPDLEHFEADYKTRKSS